MRCTQLTWSVQDHATTAGYEQLSVTQEKLVINVRLYSLYTTQVTSSGILLIKTSIIRYMTCQEFTSGLLLDKNWHHQAYYLPRTDIIRFITYQELASSGT
jgi:hypothetical protein